MAKVHTVLIRRNGTGSIEVGHGSALLLTEVNFVNKEETFAAINAALLTVVEIDATIQTIKEVYLLTPPDLLAEFTGDGETRH